MRSFGKVSGPILIKVELNPNGHTGGVNASDFCVCGDDAAAVDVIGVMMARVRARRRRERGRTVEVSELIRQKAEAS